MCERYSDLTKPLNTERRHTVSDFVIEFTHLSTFGLIPSPPRSCSASAFSAGVASAGMAKNC